MPDNESQEQEDALIQKLQIANEKYASLFEGAGDSILIFDVRTLKVIEANSNAVRRLGYSREELLQLTLADIEVPIPSDAASKAIWESAFSGTQVYECQYRRKNGTLIPVEISSRLTRYNRQEVLQNFVRDITIRKQVENEREQLIVDLEAYAHTVAHDLKNPLGVAMGYALLLLDDYPKVATEEGKRFLREIVNSSQKIVSIIDELLLLASIRQLDEVEIMPLDMGDIVQEALLRLTFLNDGQPAKITLPKKGDWPQALGYGAWVEEIWANYLSNAIKYGGTPPVIQLGATVEGEQVRFWVRDNGAGLSDEEQEKLFTQFTRLDTTQAQGHGLGLSIAKRIADKLGGQVGVECPPEGGSIFSFTLPAVK